MDSRLIRAARVPMVLSLTGALASCGGGAYVVPPDGNDVSKSQKLSCSQACIASDSVSIDKLRQSYVLVNDGQDARAYAAFGTGVDPRANVEVSGTDQVRVVTPQGTQKFYVLQPNNLGTAIANAFITALTGPLPYGSDLSQAQAAQAVQFQFVRGSTVYTSTVTAPASFSISAPTSNAALAISTRALEVRLTSATPATISVQATNCTDTNGNTATSSAQALSVTPSTSVPGSYAVDLGAYLDGLSFSTTYPRGLLSQCNLTLMAFMQADGQPAPGFASTVVLAQQLRRVSVTLR